MSVLHLLATDRPAAHQCCVAMVAPGDTVVLTGSGCALADDAALVAELSAVAELWVDAFCARQWPVAAPIGRLDSRALAEQAARCGSSVTWA